MDLFCGIGGMSLGFENAGFKIQAAFDKWERAVDVYNNNFEHNAKKIDLNELNDYSIFKKYNYDFIIGGPPCQDFSIAGKRDEDLGRADLTIVFADIISELKPNWFVMENVSRIKSSKTIKVILKILKDADYGLTAKVLDASRCGVPQARKRYFLIGELNGQDGALNYYLEKNLASDQMTMHDYFGKNLGIEYYYRHPWSYKRRGVFSIHEPSPTIRGVNRPIPSGYKGHSNDAVDISENNVRALTTKERSLVQTFPEDFELEGTKTSLEQMIGNAVPVKMAEYVANCINEYIKDKKENNLKFGKVKSSGDKVQLQKSLF